MQKMLPVAGNACVVARGPILVHSRKALPTWSNAHVSQWFACKKSMVSGVGSRFARSNSSVTSTLTNNEETSKTRPFRRAARRSGILEPPTAELTELPDAGVRQRFDTRGQVAAHPETMISRRSSLPKDMLMERIMLASTVEEVLTILDRHLEVMNDFQAAVSVKRMRDFLRELPTSELRRTIASICNHPAFRLVCDRLYDRAYLMGSDTTVIILDFLRWCNVSMRTRVAQVYLNMLRQHIQKMDVHELFSAHVVLERLPRVAIVDAMLTALPIACELRYDNEIDPDYLPGLLHALNYFGRIGMSEVAKTKLANSLVHHTPHFTIDDAVTVLRFARGLPANSARLLQFCMDMVIQEGLVSSKKHREFSPGQLQKLLDNVSERGLLSIRMVQRVIEYSNNLRSPLDHLKLALELGDLKIFDFKMLDRVADDIVNDLSLIETKWISHKQMRIIRLFASAAYKPKNGNTMLDLLIGSSVSTLESGQFLSNDLELLLTIQYCLVLRHWPSGLVNRLFSEPFFSDLLKQFPAENAGTREGGSIDSSLRMMLALRSVVQTIDTVYPQHASMVPEKARDLLRRCTDWIRAYRYVSLEKNLHTLASRDVVPAENAVVHGIVDRYGCCFDYALIVNSRSKACVDIAARMREQPGNMASKNVDFSSAHVNAAAGAKDARAAVMYELEALQKHLRNDEKLVVICIRGPSIYCVSHENRMLGVYLSQNQSLKLRGLAPINVRTDHWDQLSPQEQRLFIRRLVQDAVSDEDSLRDTYTIDTVLDIDEANGQFCSKNFS